MNNTVIAKTGSSICTGCGACVNVCPRDALAMAQDHNGFMLPALDGTRCVSCGKCAQVCPALQPDSDNSPEPGCWAFKAPREIRLKSSSGGIFLTLARHWLDMGGYVSGAVFDAQFRVMHIVSNQWRDIERMAGSKYVQSDAGDVYRQIKVLLENDKQVLFTGAPCQAAALRHFLGAPYANLLTVDFICHGVPSCAIFQKALRELASGQEIENVSFRNKIYGWSHDTLRIESNKKVIEDSVHDYGYYKAYLSNLINRESCYACAFAGIPRQADLSMADFWQVSEHLPKIRDKYGVSLILINNERGQTVFDNVIAKNGEVFPVNAPVEKAAGRIYSKSAPHPGRKRFFALVKAASFKKATTYVLKKQYDVGCVGPYDHTNFGSALTYFALYHVLEDMGFSVLMIPPPTRVMAADKILNDTYEPGTYPVYSLAGAVANKDELRELNNKCKAFVTGSDQMFNYYCYKCVKGYVSQDWVTNDKKKIAYAASFGHDQIFSTAEEIRRMSYFMNKFDYFSVRESSGVDICAKIFGIKAEHVLDPVFLCAKQHFVNIANLSKHKRKVEGKYIYVYLVDPDQEKEKFISDAAASLNLPSIIYPDWNITRNHTLPLTFGNINQRLKDFIDADFILTDSFHAVCFAIIFNKPFIIYANKVRGYARFRSLLNATGLMHRMVYCYNDYLKNKFTLLTTINYGKVENALAIQIEHSKAWLKNAMTSSIVKEADLYDIISEDIYELKTYIKSKFSAIEKIKADISAIMANLALTYMELDTDLVRIADIYAYFVELGTRQAEIIIVIVARDTPVYKPSPNLLSAFAAIGIKTDMNDKFRKSFIAVIDKGAVIHEAVSDAHEAISYKHNLPSGKLELASASFDSGNYASARLNAVELCANGRGLNIVVFNAHNGKILDSVSFDTYLPEAPAFRLL